MRAPKKIIVPELLDLLPADDPRACRSRADLVRINAVMGQAGIMAKALAGFAAPRLVVDLGGGDGRFLLAVARRLKQWRDVRAVILDRQAIVARQTQDGFEELGWSCEVIRGDIFETLPHLSPDLITANLFLHHLQDVDLGQLLGLVAARARGFVACEPRRSPLALLGARLVFVLGANDVTRHDAVASVRAGFSDRELSSLWPRSWGWVLAERGHFPFTHLFVAEQARAV
jgi:SAM-dependent methyltransferase